MNIFPLPQRLLVSLIAAKKRHYKNLYWEVGYSAGNIDLQVVRNNVITTRIVIINGVEKSEEWTWGGTADAEVWTNQTKLYSREGVWVSIWEQVHSEEMEMQDIGLMEHALNALGANEQEIQEIILPLRNYIKERI